MFPLKSLKVSLALAVALLLTAFTIGVSHAQGDIVTYPRYDMDFQIQTDGSVLTTETQTVDFKGTTRRRGFTDIPLVNVGNITDVSVSEPGGQPYRNSSSGDPGTFTATRERAANGDPVMRITLNFQPTAGQKTFLIKYRLNDALRIADAGDQFYWAALRSGRVGPIENSRVTVALPQAVDSSQIRAEGSVDGRTSIQGTVRNGQTIEYNIRNLPSNAQFETRVQFPHGIVNAQPPAWQNQVEQTELDAERAANIAATINLAGIVFGGLILFGGGLTLLLAYYSRGRDPQTTAASDVRIVREPPSNLRPAVVGTLLDEKAAPQDVVSTLVDLANRNVLNIEEARNDKLVGSDLDFKFKIEDRQAISGLLPYEQTLMNVLFGESDEFMMSELKGRFYSGMPTWESDLYNEVVRQRLFVANPEQVRKRYRRIGGALAGLGAVVLFVGLCVGMIAGALAFLPGASLLIIGLIMMAVASAMPKRTVEGVRQTVVWRAFRDYLANIEQYEPVERAKQVFQAYLPYAVAMGIDQTWVRKFAQVGTPVPEWYKGLGVPQGFPAPTGGPVIFPGGGWGYPGRPVGPIIIAGSGGNGGQPGQGGGNMPTNPDQISGGLADMLDRASRSLASGSWGGGGGGGGWSSGGGGWGGGGGGGGGASSGWS